MAFARSTKLPLSKSAPRAAWAFIILSVSSISVGIKRSAMVIIMANSWLARQNAETASADFQCRRLKK